jgi:uncharacterized Zn finger protein (UPF0148 family)
MAHCPECGTRIGKTAKFCRECGCKLESDEFEQVKQKASSPKQKRAKHTDINTSMSNERHEQRSLGSVITEGKDVHHWIKVLNHRNTGKRAHATVALSWFSHDYDLTVPALLRACYDKDGLVRDQAHETLLNYGEAAIFALARAAQSGDIDMRNKAKLTIFDIKGKRISDDDIQQLSNSGCKLIVTKNERGNPRSSRVTNKPVSPDIQNNLNSHHYKSEPLSLEKTHEYRRPEDAYGQVYINGITRCVLMVRYLLLPLEMVTTVALGIVIGIPPIGIVYCLIMTIIWAPFFGYMAGISWLCKKLPLLGIPLSIIGIPLVLVIDIFLQLMPNPDKEDKANKAIICSNYPLSVLPEMIEP